VLRRVAVVVFRAEVDAFGLVFAPVLFAVPGLAAAVVFFAAVDRVLVELREVEPVLLREADVPRDDVLLLPAALAFVVFAAAPFDAPAEPLRAAVARVAVVLDEGVVRADDVRDPVPPLAVPFAAAERLLVPPFAAVLRVDVVRDGAAFAVRGFAPLPAAALRRGLGFSSAIRTSSGGGAGRGLLLVATRPPFPRRSKSLSRETPAFAHAVPAVRRRKTTENAARRAYGRDRTSHPRGGARISRDVRGRAVGPSCFQGCRQPDVRVDVVG
jgi:hypothetical protein